MHSHSKSYVEKKLKKKLINIYFGNTLLLKHYPTYSMSRKSHIDIYSSDDVLSEPVFCRMGIFVIVPTTIPESFQIIICRRLNFISKSFLVVYLRPFRCLFFLGLFVSYYEFL
jgi:hypothetical protein